MMLQQSATSIAPRRAELVSGGPDDQTTAAIVAYCLRLLPDAQRPQRLARMSEPGETKRDRKTGRRVLRDKYEDVYDVSLHDALQRHALGDATFSYTIDRDGMARSGAIDIDQGGKTVLCALLDVLASDGIHAWAVEMQTTGGHTGGHVRVEFDQLLPVALIERYLRDVARRADLADWKKIEVWPGNKQGIRGPLGAHRATKSRGVGTTQAGERFDLDAPAELAAFVAFVTTLQPNSAPPEVAPVNDDPPAATVASPKIERRISLGEQGAARLNLANVRERFNADHSLESLLLDLGATRTRDGFACPCGVQHTHETTLYISKQGKLFSYSPRCRFATTKGWDAFGLYVKTQHHDNILDALRTLNPPTAPRATTRPPHAAEGTDYRTQVQDRDAARKRTQRRTAARQKLDAIDTRLRADDALSERAMLLAAYLLDRSAGEHLQVSPTNSQIVAALDWQTERTAQRAFRDLEAAGYGARTGGRGGLDRPNQAAIWTWGKPGADVPRVTVAADENAAYGKLVTLVDLDHDLYSESGACERPPVAASAPVLDLDGLAAFESYEPEAEALFFDLPEAPDRVVAGELAAAPRSQALPAQPPVVTRQPTICEWRPASGEAWAQWAAMVDSYTPPEDYEQPAPKPRPLTLLRRKDLWRDDAGDVWAWPAAPTEPAAGWKVSAHYGRYAACDLASGTSSWHASQAAAVAATRPAMQVAAAGTLPV